MPDFLDRLKTAFADRYAIEEELGAGGMTTVYPAADGSADRRPSGEPDPSEGKISKPNAT